MGKASSSKKVARAASTGGGRTNRGRTPYMYYGTLLVICVLGILGIAVSRGSNSAQAKVPPVVGDHWHAAYGIYICDHFVTTLQDVAGDKFGIHTHPGDGLIHIHPFGATAAGKNATLGAFLKDVGVTLTKTKLSVPGEKTYKNGDKCGKEVGQVRVIVWDSPSSKTGKPVAGDPNSLRLKQGQVITIAFAPPSKSIPKPASVKNVNAPSDLGSTPSPTDLTPTTALPSETPSTSLPSDSTPTTAAGPSTTLK